MCIHFTDGDLFLIRRWGGGSHDRLVVDTLAQS
jgi:hypothetical protein